MNMWTEAFDTLQRIPQENLTIDQQLKVAEIRALLAIGQDLNGMRLGETESFDL